MAPVFLTSSTEDNYTFTTHGNKITMSLADSSGMDVLLKYPYLGALHRAHNITAKKDKSEILLISIHESSEHREGTVIS